MTDLELNGRTPVMYFDAEDESMDGCGFNVLLANGATTTRWSSLELAIADYKALLEQGS
jgi:hypothetical protein